MRRCGMTRSADIGIYGLGVMGRNLAVNLGGHRYGVVRYDPWPEARVGVAAAADEAAFVASLATPRAILLMVKAGEPVDAAIARLLPLLGPGDLVIDGGNSHYRDSLRRAATLAEHGLEFLGLGVSGGEEGARRGPALMAGGEAAAYARVAPLLEAIAASAEGQPCCGRVGGAGAGHFVKMVHNGIEYAVMQLIAEIYLIQRDLLRLDANVIAAAFAEWNEGPAGGYLVELAAAVLRRRDEDGAPLLDYVRDAAEQKGTGRWAAAAALELGVPVPTLLEAVAARGLSALSEERAAAAAAVSGPDIAGGVPDLAGALGEALLGGMIAAYAQGFALLAGAAAELGGPLDLAGVARIWRAGCIIRSRLLTPIVAAFAGDPAPANLLAAPAMAGMLAACQTGWRRAVAAATSHGIAVPALASALAYYDGYRTARSGANLIQAQRDAFGAHGYARTDRPGTFHSDWTGP
jgi:6-phosphogluconate dehydrogenase